jgi:hypothetical protein
MHDIARARAKILLNYFVCYLVCKCVAVVQMGASDSDTWPREENQIERDFSFDPEILNNLCVTHMRRNFTPFPHPHFGREFLSPTCHLLATTVVWIRDRIRIRTTDLRTRIRTKFFSSVSDKQPTKKLVFFKVLLLITF